MEPESATGSGVACRNSDMAREFDIVIIGLTITSSWGNGHATTWRGLVREIEARGHRVLFLEHDKPWYAAHRDLPQPPWGQTQLYASVEDLKFRFEKAIQNASTVIVGSYVPQGLEVGEWALEKAKGLVAFYDIDTPVTLSALSRGECEYLNRKIIPRYHLYLSFTGGPTLQLLEEEYGAQLARPLYCSVDQHLYQPRDSAKRWQLGYLGTYGADRQKTLERLLLSAARALNSSRFVVAGPQYPPEIVWPENVERMEHLAPGLHPDFYASQHFTLNITRQDMVHSGFSPSVRLFEAAACQTPVLSDWWEGLDCFFEPESEILVANDGDEALSYLQSISEAERLRIGERARNRVLMEHTAAHRARELERYLAEAGL